MLAADGRERSAGASEHEHAGKKKGGNAESVWPPLCHLFLLHSIPLPSPASQLSVIQPAKISRSLSGTFPFFFVSETDAGAHALR
jgi:hypothetical protein